MSEWQPIETAPEGVKVSEQMFVVIAFNVRSSESNPFLYTSDPYCVWKQKDGSFARWPHRFNPTHWMPLPEAPK